MMVMTAKVDMKKILLVLAGVAALLLALILLLGERQGQTAPTAANSNDARVKFLRDRGWEVTTSPTESGQVRIPQQTTEVFDRYNTLQKGQGWDLSKYAGKTVMRYVYQVNNYPGATQPVYATLLVHRNEVIGGDITDTSPGGRIRGFQATEPPQTLQPAQPAPKPQPVQTAPQPTQPSGA